jgi:hypothetical protein
MVALWWIGLCCPVAGETGLSVMLGNGWNARDADLFYASKSWRDGEFEVLRLTLFDKREGEVPQPINHKVCRSLNGHLAALGRRPRLGGLSSTPVVSRLFSPTRTARHQAALANPLSGQTYGSTYLWCCALLI